MPTIKELMAQKASIEQQIAEMQKAERDAAVAKIRALMAEHGLTLADLSGKAKGRRKAGAKVAPKYRDPATGVTWSGRGLKPNWLKAALAAGKKMSDFEI